MPTIGWFEILIIIIIAIVVIGPKDFPIMLKKVGSWIGSFKRYASQLQDEITDLNSTDIEQPNVKKDKTIKDKTDE